MTVTLVNTIAGLSDEELLSQMKSLIESGIPNVVELMRRGYDVSVFLINGEVKFQNLGAPGFRVQAKKELKAV